MAEKSPPPGTPAAEPPADTENRRDFVTECAAIGIGGFVGIVPAAAGLVVFLDPWRKKDYPAAKEGTNDGFIKVAALAGITDVPRRYPVYADLIDAWTFSPNQPVGAVYLVKEKSGDIVCFNAICPHAGCFVGFSAARNEFACPCHESFFSLEGKRGGHSPSPRDLDRLTTKIVDDDGQKVVAVEFKNFQTGRTDQKVK